LKTPSAPPILLITGTPDLETACRAANLPVAGYLKKPINYIHLEAAMARILGDNRRNRDFVVVAQEIIALLSARPAQKGSDESALIGRMTQLAASFRTPGRRISADQPAEEAWRAAIAETIAVIEKTKHSFRSKELGNLRQRLQRLLIPSAAP
jgi:DNA-binding response OmpR family regulator